jgi:pimeloyl-ACP methyl ester carboxylesterase
MDLEKIYSEFPIETFSIASADDVMIPAEYHETENARGIAILAHGYGQNRYVLTPQARIFRDLGYSTIMFDQRHFGESKAPCSTFGVKEADDLIALVRYARDRFGSNVRIIVLGVSMGAMSVMHAIGKCNLIDAAIQDCGPESMDMILDPFYAALSKEPNPYFRNEVSRISARLGASLEENKPIEGVRKSSVPLLSIQGEADSLVSPQHAIDITAASGNPLSRIRMFPGREHAYSIQDYDEYSSEINRFLTDVFSDQHNIVKGKKRA